MLVTDDHTFPPQFQWEPFAATKELHSDGTKYIYAKFKDASGAESAIAFAQPRRLMYITKSATLASRPALLQVKVPAGYGIVQVRGFYRAIGGSSYTASLMALQGEVYALWVPASQTANGIEYYFQAENASGGVLATLPESNPAGQPYSLPATSMLAQSVEAGSSAAFELAVGVTVEIPAGALAQDTELQVAALSSAPAPPDGITATDVGYAFSFADGTTTFGQPVALTFSYADSDVAGLDPADLRVYTVDASGQVVLAGGTVNTTTQAVSVDVTHFSDFFVAAGSLMAPAPVTTATAGQPLTIQAATVNYVPAHSGTLFYRPGSGDWQSLALAQAGGVYQATIPAAEVTTAGLAYYIQASDGGITRTYPATDPANAPQVVTVTPPAPTTVTQNPAACSDGTTVPFSGAHATLALTSWPGGSITVNDYAAGHPDAPGGVNTASRYWRITTDAAGSFTVNLALSYEESDLYGFTEGQIVGAARWDEANARWEYFAGTVDTVANTVTLTGVTRFSDWTLLASTPPKAVTDLTGIVSGGAVQLAWTAITQNILGASIAAPQYRVYRKANDPYFTPATGDLLVTTANPTYSDAGTLGDVATNYFYVVTAVDGSGVESALSTRLGEVEFEIRAGASPTSLRWTSIAMPLDVPGVTTADQVAAYISPSSSIKKVAYWDVASQTWVVRNVGAVLGTPDFAVTVGSPLLVAANDSAPARFAWIGEVPVRGSVTYSLTPGGATVKWNFVALPFDQGSLMTADALANDIGGVTRVARWDTASQTWVVRNVGAVLGTPDFAISPGAAYLVGATGSAPATWP